MPIFYQKIHYLNCCLHIGCQQHFYCWICNQYMEHQMSIRMPFLIFSSKNCCLNLTLCHHLQEMQRSYWRLLGWHLRLSMHAQVDVFYIEESMLMRNHAQCQIVASLGIVQTLLETKFLKRCVNFQLWCMIDDLCICKCLCKCL